MTSTDPIRTVGVAVSGRERQKEDLGKPPKGPKSATANPSAKNAPSKG